MLINVLVAMFVFFIALLSVYYINKMENISVNKLIIINERQNILENLRYKNVQLKNNSIILFNRSDHLIEIDVLQKIAEINELLTKAKKVGGNDFKQLDYLSKIYALYLKNIESAFLLIKETEKTRSEKLKIQFSKSAELLKKLSDELFKRNMIHLVDKLTRFNSEFLVFKYNIYIDKPKVTKNSFYEVGLSNVLTKMDMDKLINYELELFIEFTATIDSLKETIFLLDKRENEKAVLAGKILLLKNNNQDAIILNLLENMNNTVVKYNQQHKTLISEARGTIWTLASILIIVSVIFGALLRKAVVRAVNSLLTLTRLTLSADFKQIQLITNHNLEDKGVKVEAFNEINRALRDISVHQQQMIFDIDTACQGLTMGYLDQNTSFSYQGEYQLIEHSLNVARTSINTIVEETVKSCDAIAEGDLTRLNNLSVFNADYKAIKQSFSNLSLNLQRQLFDILSVTSNMEQGLADKKKFSLPNDYYQGEFAQIHTRLTTTVDYLKQFAQHNFDQNWLKSGLSDMNSQLTGEQPLETLTKNSVDFLCQYFDAPIGYLYRSIEDKNIGRAIRLISHYGVLMDEDTRLTQYKFVYPEGVGLIGQVFVSSQMIVKELAADERQPISQSGIASAMLNYIVVLPLMHEGKVEGVLELGLYRKPSKIQREFLHQVKSNLGIAINVAVSRDKMKLLLARSQHQAVELELHQSKLGSSNCELQHQAKQLQEKQQAVEFKNNQLELASHKMEEKTKELILTSRYKSEFLANMSHELRSPLNSLLILSKLLSDNRKGNLDDNEVKYAEVIHRSGSDLLILIEDILDHSKIEAGKTELHFSHENLEDMLALIKESFSQVALEKKLDFTLSYTAAPMVVEVDKKRLIQVLTNLLANAFKFTLEGSVSLNVSVHQQGEVYDIQGDEHHKLEFDALCFCVKDTGIGIAEEHKENVFKAFAQADGTTSRKFGGTGLGLSISLHLVELMGGFLYLATEIKQGSQFYLYIPLRTLNENVIGEHVTLLKTASVQQPKVQRAIEKNMSVDLLVPQVLYLCGTASNSRLIEQVLATKGLKIRVISTSFSQALVALSEHHYAGVLLDGQIVENSHLSDVENFEAVLLTRDMPLLVIDETQLNALSPMSQSTNNKSAMHKLTTFVRSLEADLCLSQHAIMQSYFDQTQMLADKKVLIVDDHISNVFALTAILENHKIKYEVANNGLQAIEIIKETKDFDLILMDIMMPDLDGYQTMKAIREYPVYLNTPIIALTAKAMPEDRNKCILAGANDYMTKPLDADRLMVLLKMWLVTTPNVAKLCKIN